MSHLVRGPRQSVKFALFALSGNGCAFPSCEAAMYSADTILGEVCHIHAQNPGGPRFRADLSPENLHALDNLILLCPKHHKIVDEHPDEYDADTLRSMKANHELRAEDTSASLLRSLLDRLAPSVPNSWWERPGAPVFQLNLASNRPETGAWVFEFGLEQIDGGDIGPLRYRYRHGNEETELRLAELVPPSHGRRKWRLDALNLQARGDPLDLELAFWWDGAQRSLTYRWEKERDFQTIEVTKLYA